MEKLDEIYEYVNSIYGIDIKNQTRKRKYTEARALFYLLARNLTNFTYQIIGQYIGKDHASVIYGFKNITHHLDKELIAESLKRFGLTDQMPTDTISYLKHKTKKLEERLNEKEKVLSLIPNLERIYKNSKNIEGLKKQRLDNKNTHYFEQIGKNLDMIEYNIDLIKNHE